MRLKKNYLTLLVITIAVIILCFMLPSALFKLYDNEWTERRVEKSANTSGLNIDSMSLNEKLQLIYSLDAIENALSGDTGTSMEAAILSRGYKLTKEEAWSNIMAEVMKLGDGLETLMPEFYKYMASIQNYSDAMKYTDSDAIQPILVTDEKGNSTILWIMNFQMDSDFAAEQENSSYIPPFAQIYYDESSGYILGMELYNLDADLLDDFEPYILQDMDEETAVYTDMSNAEMSDAEVDIAVNDESPEVTVEQGIARYFLKRYAEYVGWWSKDNQMTWSYAEADAHLEISNGNEYLDLICDVYYEENVVEENGNSPLTIKLNREY